jgi:hypothetical protein
LFPVTESIPAEYVICARFGGGAGGGV